MLNYNHQTVENQQHHDSHHVPRPDLIDYSNANYGTGSQFSGHSNMVPTSTTSANSDLVQQFNGTQFFNVKNNISDCASSSVVGHDNVGVYPASDHTQLQYKSSENTKRFSVNNLLQLPGCRNDDRRDQTRG